MHSQYISIAHSLFLTGPLEDDSPYPEVRAAVANFDDPDMPVSTLRAWTLGIFWAIVLPGINQFFYFRYPSIMVTGVSGLVPITAFFDVYILIKHSAL